MRIAASVCVRARDMPARLLAHYRAKRNLRQTPEPAGGRATKGTKPIFVVQKHAARALHYDVRLQVGHVLKSWAVPKGPSLNPKVRRLAMPTEDHPFDYARFEGIIPEGQYGAGTVIVWDIGTYRNLREEKADPRRRVSMPRALREGLVEVRLEGKKLRGAFAFIRTGKGPNNRWLLVKMRDVDSTRTRRTRVDERSVLSGNTLAEMKAAKAHGKSR
jgi:bifunctional non-homologous end joining protein LigD